MTTVLKCTTILSVILCAEVFALGNLVFTHHDVDVVGDAPVVATSDVAYVSSAKTDVADAVVVEEVAESDVVSDEVAVESDSALDEVVVSDDAIAVSDDAIAEFETDWQPYQETDDYVVYDDYNYVYDNGEVDVVVDESWNTDSGEYSEVSVDEGWSSNSDGCVNANVDGNWISGSDFRFSGVYQDSSGYSYTYYSENVLPGGGLNIPGRHVNDEGYVVDENENLCVASDDLPYGTMVSVPFGTGTAVVYDCGGGNGNLDVYVSW